jgi:hypothetical protein
LISAPAFAVQKKASVTTNPFSLMFGIMGLEGNFAVGDSVSIPASLSYFSYEDTTDLVGFYEETGTISIIGLGTGLRYYWQGNAINGWYLGGIINMNILSLDYEKKYYGGAEYTGSASASVIGMGFLIGYQAIWESGFTLDAGLGMTKYTLPDFDVEAEASGGATKDETFEGVSLTLPSIKLALGYAF